MSEKLRKIFENATVYRISPYIYGVTIKSPVAFPDDCRNKSQYIATLREKKSPLFNLIGSSRIKHALREIKPGNPRLIELGLHSETLGKWNEKSNDHKIIARSIITSARNLDPDICKPEDRAPLLINWNKLEEENIEQTLDISRIYKEHLQKFRDEINYRYIAE